LIVRGKEGRIVAPFGPEIPPVYPGLVGDVALLDFALRGPLMEPSERVVGASFALVSLPFDLVFDTLMLPFDGVSWSLSEEIAPAPPSVPGGPDRTSGR